MKAEKIKLMPDYQCFPLWRIGKSTVENISHNELKLSSDLKDLMARW